MPTLPLYATTPIAGPEDWHRVESPGGYEVWRFVAGDRARDLWLIASLSWGSTTDRDYLRQYARYRRRPTRHAPPVPSQNCSATLALYESGKLILQFDTPFDGFRASAGQIGASADHMTVDPAGQLHLHLAGRMAAVNLSFHPLPAPSLPEIDLLDSESPTHRWSLSRPVCNVTGEIAIAHEPASEPLVFKINARGCHDHIWGTRPLAWDFRSGLFGWVLTPERTFAFAHLVPRGARLPITRLIATDSATDDHLAAQAAIVRPARPRFIARGFPRQIRFNDRLILENLRPLSAGSVLHLIYDVRWPGGEGVAICRLIDWPRL
jgi:hypothetical protein